MPLLKISGLGTTTLIIAALTIAASGFTAPISGPRFIYSDLAAHMAESQNAFSLAPSGLQGVKFTAKIVYGNQFELRKISEDFGKTYRFQYANVEIARPFKIRVESVVDDQSVLVIGNGPSVLYKVPRAGIHSSQNIENQPGRRQTFLDFGMITPELSEFFNSKFVRKDRATGDDVYDLTYRNKAAKDTTRYRIWINPERHNVDRREWYGQVGEYRAAFVYSGPKKIDGIWVPTDVTVTNSDGKKAGEMKMVNIDVNPKFSDSDFKV